VQKFLLVGHHEMISAYFHLKIICALHTLQMQQPLEENIPLLKKTWFI